MSRQTETLTVQETAQALGVHPNTIRRWADRGVLHPRRLPSSGFRRFERREVDALANQFHGGEQVAAGEDMGTVTNQWATWVRRAETAGIRIDLAAYNARVLASEAEPAADEAALPAPWGQGFREMGYDELVALMNGAE